MTVLYFESKRQDCRLGPVEVRKITDGPLKGYDEYYQNIYNDGNIVEQNDLVYVKDSYEDNWLPAKFVAWRDDGIAILLNELEECSWRYMLIPKR